MANLFERLAPGQSQQTKKLTERRPRNAGFVAQGVKDAKIKAFLLDILAKGPAPTTTIQKRGAAQGFTRKQLWRAKGIIGAVAFKKGMGIQGRWFWARAQHNPNTIKPGRRFTSRLRNLSRSLGYRLQPIGGSARNGRSPKTP